MLIQASNARAAARAFLCILHVLHGESGPSF